MEIGPDNPVFPIGVVRKLTGLTDRQIRYYDQTGLVVPARSRGNRRLYSAREVAALRRIKGIIAPGMKISQLKEKLAAEKGVSSAGAGVNAGGAAAREGDYRQGPAAYQQHSPLKQGEQRLYTRGYLDELLAGLLSKERVAKGRD